METAIEFYNHLVSYFRANYINFAFIVFFLIIGFAISGFIQRRVRVRLGAKSPNHITATFTSQLIGFTLKTMVVFATMYLLGLNSFTNKLLAGAGLLTFVVGFALKDIGENFLAGIILAFKSPFRLDDLIEVNGIVGHVKDISIRETLVKTPDGKDVFIPNSLILKNPLYNYTMDGFLRYEFTLGITYDTDPTAAIQLLLKTVSQVEGVLNGDKKPNVTLSELTSNNITVKVMFWINTFHATRRSVHNSIRSQVMNDVVAALTANGLSVPNSFVAVKILNEMVE